MHPATIKILFVEDHKALLENLAEYFAGEQYELDFAADGLTALHLLAENTYDIAVLDIMLPGVDGLKILQRIRQDLHSGMPVIMLTALDDINKKIAGFEGGSDDYLCKPFNMKELQLRIHALVKRNQQRNPLIQAGNISFDSGTLCVSNGKTSLVLTGYGGSIFELLIAACPNYVSYTHISEKLWGIDHVDENTIRTHVYTLRKQLTQAFGKSMIRSVYKKGYQFDPQQE